MSISEVAKQLLESADDERVEFVKLISDPIKSLLNIRQKAEANLPLSKTEWLMVAWFCQRGAEALSDNVQNQISNESLIGILEAFRAVYNLQTAKRTPRDPFYIANLVTDEEAANERAAEIGSRDVRRAVDRSIQTLRDPSEHQRKPILAGRSLFYVIDETEIVSIQKLNEVLMPYWKILWRICARGHDFSGANQSSMRSRPGRYLTPLSILHYPDLRKANAASFCPVIERVDSRFASTCPVSFRLCIR